MSAFGSSFPRTEEYLYSYASALPSERRRLHPDPLPTPMFGGIKEVQGVDFKTPLPDQHQYLVLPVHRHSLILHGRAVSILTWLLTRDAISPGFLSLMILYSSSTGRHSSSALINSLPIMQHTRVFLPSLSKASITTSSAPKESPLPLIGKSFHRSSNGIQRIVVCQIF